MLCAMHATYITVHTNLHTLLNYHILKLGKMCNNFFLFRDMKIPELWNKLATLWKVLKLKFYIHIFQMIYIADYTWVFVLQFFSGIRIEFLYEQWNCYWFTLLKKYNWNILQYSQNKLDSFKGEMISKWQKLILNNFYRYALCVDKIKKPIVVR